MLLITNPKGTIPLASKYELPLSHAQKCENCHVWSGAARPIKDHSDQSITGIDADIRTIYLFGREDAAAEGKWFRWDDDVDISKGPIALDTQERTYFTGHQRPKMTLSAIAAASGTSFPAAAYTLGIPKARTPVATKVGTANGDEALRESRAYVMTYVSAYNEEGPPSNASNIIDDLDPGQQVNLTLSALLPTGVDAANYNITHKRIYRSHTTAAGTNFQFLVQLALATATYADTTDASGLAETIRTEGWVSPPSDMAGMCFTANGIGAGFSKNALCLSVPYVPHAWPVEFRKYTDYNIVAIAPMDNAIVVGTIEEPYICLGNHPSGMTLRKIDIQQGCISKRSMKPLGSIGVIYASGDGLVVIRPGGSYTILTQPYFSYSEWQALNPSSMHGYVFDNRYYCFYTQANGAKGGFYVDPENMQNGVVFLDGTKNHVTAGFHDPLTGRFYVVNDSGDGAKLKLWEGANSKQNATWRSKRITVARPNPYGFCRITAEDYDNLKFRLYYLNQDGSLVNLYGGNAFKAVESERPFKLSRRYRCREIELEVFGQSAWTSIALSESAAEMALLDDG